jgi:hypothetical protein
MTSTNLNYTTQNNLLMTNLLKYYELDNNMDYMLRIINGESRISLRIIDWFATNYAKKYYTVYTIGDSEGSGGGSGIACRRFKVYVDYKLKLKAYSKKRFDPFCRWDRITVPYKDGKYIQTTIGQLNFFKWALENNVIRYIEENYANIEKDMNNRNSTSKKKLLSAGTASSSTSNVSNVSSDSNGYNEYENNGENSYNEIIQNEGNEEGEGGEGNEEGDGYHGLENSTKMDTNNKTRKKREELSISATKSIKKEKVEIVVNFD